MDRKKRINKVESLIDAKNEANFEMGKIAVDVLKEKGGEMELQLNGYYDIPEYNEVYFKKARLDKNDCLEVEFDLADYNETYTENLFFLNVDDMTFNDIILAIVDPTDEQINDK